MLVMENWLTRNIANYGQSGIEYQSITFKMVKYSPVCKENCWNSLHYCKTQIIIPSLGLKKDQRLKCVYKKSYIEDCVHKMFCFSCTTKSSTLAWSCHLRWWYGRDWWWSPEVRAPLWLCSGGYTSGVSDRLVRIPALFDDWFYFVKCIQFTADSFW